MGAGESKEGGPSAGAPPMSGVGASVVILERYGKENGCITWMQAPCNFSRKTPSFPTDVPLALGGFLRDAEYKPGIIYPLNDAASSLPTPTFWFCGPALSIPLAGLIAGWVMWGFGWAAMLCVALLIISVVYLNWQWKRLAKIGENRILVKANELSRRWKDRGVTIRFDVISTEELGFGGSTRLCHLTITVDPRVVAQNAADEIKMAAVGGMQRVGEAARGVMGGGQPSASGAPPPGGGPPSQMGPPPYGAPPPPGRGPPPQMGPPPYGAPPPPGRGPPSQMGPPPYGQGAYGQGAPHPSQASGPPAAGPAPTPPQSDYQRQVEFQRRQQMLQQQRHSNPYAQDRRDVI